MPDTPDDALPEGESVALSLPADLTAPHQARGFVRATLERWRLPQLVDACVLAVSELVTNALRHGRPPVNLHLGRHESKVELGIQDAGDGPAAAPGEVKDPLAESGRGLGIVEAVSDEVAAQKVPGDGTRLIASWKIDGDE
jgi:anti-sigma regulatory factor (Ser/Thr protein kinase)